MVEIKALSPSPKRAAISKKLRFQVFKRDGFVCAYCGAHPPESTMEIDHVIPVADGGDNRIVNLITACYACNRGKGGEPLSVIPPSVVETAALLAEREAQIRAYYAVLQEVKDRRDKEAWAIAEVMIERFDLDGIRHDHLNAIHQFLSRLGYFEVLEAMEIATRRQWIEQRAFRYFCGVCWNKINRAERGEE